MRTIIHVVLNGTPIHYLRDWHVIPRIGETLVVDSDCKRFKVEHVVYRDHGDFIRIELIVRIA